MSRGFDGARHPHLLTAVENYQPLISYAGTIDGNQFREMLA
jgi:hypothetical protein